MPVSAYRRRQIQAALGWTAAVGFVVGTVLVYRWAEPSSTPNAAIQPAGSNSNVTIRLENAPFFGHSNGYKTWSLHAGRIELERMPGASLSSLESVSLSDIKDGLLFPTPPPMPAAPAAAPSSSPHPAGQTAIGLLSPENEAAYGPWTARFRAGHGHYNSGMLAQPPPDLATLYRLQSAFDLSQGVALRTREGDLFEADSLSVFDLLSKQNGHSERRILCNNGMKLTRKDGSVAANQARYDVANRTVECLGGARVTFSDGSFQTERMYWSLDEGILRCPDAAAGTLRGAPFNAQGMTIDLKKHHMHANQITFELRSDSQEKRHF